MTRQYHSLSDLSSDIIESQYDDCKVNQDGSVSIFSSSPQLPELIAVASEHEWEYSYVQNTGEQLPAAEYIITYRQKG